MAKKGYNYPIKKKIPLILLLNLFGIIIISHFLRFVNIFNAIYQITFREVEKSLPCVKGAFYLVHLCLVNFPDNY